MKQNFINFRSFEKGTNLIYVDFEWHKHNRPNIPIEQSHWYKTTATQKEKASINKQKYAPKKVV